MNLRRFPFLLAVSLCLVALVGLTRWYEELPPQAVGLTVVFGTGAILCLYRFLKPFRESVDALTLDELVCLHSVRAPIGASFLVMSHEGLFPALFANRAGYGDLCVALSGLLVVAIASRLTNITSQKILYSIWNVVGLVDLSVALGTGIYLATSQPDSMIWISRLPLLVVPILILPLLFSTHFLMLARIPTMQSINRQISAK